MNDDLIQPHEKKETEHKKVKFSHVHNDDIVGCTFLYFDSGFVQDLSGNKDIQFDHEFCLHLDSQDVDKLKSALANELNENLVLSPKEAKAIKLILEQHRQLSYRIEEGEPLYNFPEGYWKVGEWREFLEKFEKVECE